MSSAIRGGGSENKELVKDFGKKNTVGNEEEWPTKGLSDKGGDSEAKGPVKGFSFKRRLEVMN